MDGVCDESMNEHHVKSNHFTFGSSRKSFNHSQFMNSKRNLHAKLNGFSNEEIRRKKSVIANTSRCFSMRSRSCFGVEHVHKQQHSVINLASNSRDIGYFINLGRKLDKLKTKNLLQNSINQDLSKGSY